MLLADFLDYMKISSNRLRLIAADCLRKPGIRRYDTLLLYDSLLELASIHRQKNQSREYLEATIQAQAVAFRADARLSRTSATLLNCKLASAISKYDSQSCDIIIRNID